MRWGKMKIMENMEKKKIYAFIDSQNLNLGTSKDLYRGEKRIYKGWKLDYQKFRRYLQDKFGVEKAFLFIGHMTKYEDLYSVLKKHGYTLIFKPTVQDNHGKPKGNVDAELVLHASAIEYPNYDLAVIVSGDGDFYCLHRFLQERDKLLKIVIPNTKAESSLLKKFQSYKTFLIYEKAKLEYESEHKKREASHVDTGSKARILPGDKVSIAKKGRKAR